MNEAPLAYPAAEEPRVRKQQELTLARFVEERFVPDRVARRKPSTRIFYGTMLHTLCAGVAPAPLRKLRGHTPVGRVPTVRTHGLGSLTLASVSYSDVQTLVNTLLDRGYSVAMARKVQGAARLVFEYARRLRLYGASNPAEDCCFPEAAPVRERHALTLDQLRALLAELPEPYRTMVLTAALTGLNVAELAGLRWGGVNLTDAPTVAGARLLAPFSLRVTEQYTAFGYGTPKTKNRRRDVPLCGPVVAALLSLSTVRDAERPVFAYANGHPVNGKSALARVLKPAGARAGVAWLTWHDLRRTFATLTDAAGLSPAQRQALLGHATAAMTAHYTLASVEGTRTALDSLAASL